MGCDITPVITRLLSRRFNSRSPSGLRQKGGDVVSFVLEFQFTQPKWAATCGGKLPRLVGVFQFTQPKRAATTSGTTSRHVTSVSIHAAQAGCDIIFLRIEFDFIVSIHAAQAGCDCRCAFFYFPRIEFQFTQPKRAATVRRLIRYRGCIRFNSRSPSGLRHAFPAKFSIFSPVSIHAAQAGCDAYAYNRNNDRKVSIHAAQAGCDFRDRSAYCFE